MKVDEQELNRVLNIVDDMLHSLNPNSPLLYNDCIMMFVEIKSLLQKWKQ